MWLPGVIGVALQLNNYYNSHMATRSTNPTIIGILLSDCDHILLYEHGSTQKSALHLLEDFTSLNAMFECVNKWFAEGANFEQAWAIYSDGSREPLEFQTTKKLVIP